MTKLVLIRGNAGSGKTSLATALQERLGEGTLLLSQDLLRRTMLHAKDSFDTPTIPLILTLFDWGKTNSSVIILEGILRSDWYAPVWESIAEQFAGAIYAYYYDLPFEETLRRHTTRPKAAEFGEDSLRRWWLEKDYLIQIAETKLSSQLTLDQAVSLILSDIEPATTD